MLDRLKRRLLFSRPLRRLIGWGQRIVLPGFEGFSIYAISRFFMRAIGEGRLETRASAISFKLFVAFFPAVIVLLTLIPFIPIHDFQAKLLTDFRRMLPLEVYHFIESTLHDLVVKKHSTLLSVSFLVGIYLASNSMDAILRGFSESTHLTTWHAPLKQRLLSMGLLLGLTILLVTAILVLTLSDTVVGWAEQRGLLPGDLSVSGLLAAKWAVGLLLVMAIISLLYNAGDPSATRFKFFTPGAILATVLFLLASQALAFLFGHITDYNALYGSIGVILAVQLWLYVNMLVLLVGFELNTSIRRASLLNGRQLRMGRR